MDLRTILDFKLFSAGTYSLSVYHLIMVLVIVVLVRMILWMIKKALNRQSKFKRLDPGSEYALYKIISYVIWIITAVFILEMLGVKISILLAGSAALLVGIGLGLQQTFNDIISGIILLIEGTTKVGDILSVEGDVVRMDKIGLRASKVVNRDDVMIIIPNSLIVTNKVVNWSHQEPKTRFNISVGVAYGSDVPLVMRLLIESAAEHQDVAKNPKPDARFVSFGDSSLDFKVFFWSSEMFRIEKCLSEIRMTIDRKFRENKVTIPFPQRDVHMITKT